jgi:hypothetical protein
MAENDGIGRRSLLQAGLGTATIGTLVGPAAAQATDPTEPTAPLPASRSAPLERPYNIVLFITDEEAYHLRPAEAM